MIYLDNAATSFPKPDCVIRAVTECMTDYCANPGRGGHQMSLRAGRAVYRVREQIAEFFHLDDPLRVIFTSNTTEGLNLALHGCLRAGDHVIATAMDHNSILRPLCALEEEGVEKTIVPCEPDGTLSLQKLEAAIRPNTRMIACNHASNLVGIINPVEQIGALCRKYGLLFLMDAAQSAGVLPIDVQEMQVDLLAAPGHKGIMGIPGSGFLYIGTRAEVRPLQQGGTGSRSEEICQPAMWPDRYESGTLNLPGIVSIGAGLSFLENQGPGAVEQKERELMRMLYDGVRNISGLTSYGTPDLSRRTAVLAVNKKDMTSSELAAILDADYGICARAGMHCAPLAHETLGTKALGAVRLSPGYFNTREDVERVLAALEEI
ncbi:MAG: aminotransferase class V-fold PLP-dependent enzyme [Lachnospiraceae bacterium]|nr:aminotransferase class V-fold PLP-dependent enzyme [Lachnospiraceae bacterium]